VRSAAELAAEVLVVSGTASGILYQVVVGWLREWLGSLAGEYREAVELAELHGLSSSQIADRLGLSISGAKSRVQRGRAQLRAILENCCHLDFDRQGNVVDYHRRGDCDRCGDRCGDC
jgi:RNA polymerase sigma-70 factor (ECF subfamily)